MRKKHNNVIVDQLILMDHDLALQNKGFALSILMAKNLQKKLEAKYFDLDMLYDAVMTHGTYKSDNK